MSAYADFTLSSSVGSHFAHTRLVFKEPSVTECWLPGKKLQGVAILIYE